MTTDLGTGATREAESRARSVSGFSVIGHRVIGQSSSIEKETALLDPHGQAVTMVGWDGAIASDRRTGRGETQGMPRTRPSPLAVAAALLGLLPARPGRHRRPQERDRLPGHGRPRQAAALGLRRPEAGRPPRLEGRSGSTPTPRSATSKTFKLEQPLVVHGGAMPKEVIRRRGRALERPGPAGVRLRGVEAGQGRPDGAGDQRAGPVPGQDPRASTASGRASSPPARSPARSSWASSPRSTRRTGTSGSGSPGS